MTITLSKTETAILVAAATRPGGAIEIPPGTKPGSRERLIGRFLRDVLVEADGEGHRLTPAGYRAIGLPPPRAKRPVEADVRSGAGRAGSKKALILELLGRGEGATLAELIAATGWLPHTTRAVLSRLRSGGDALSKSKRPDGATAYRIEASTPPEPVIRKRRGTKEAAAETRVAV